MRLSLPLLALLGACFPRSDVDAAADEGDDSRPATEDTAEDASVIRAVTPTDGTTAGGQEVTVQGEGFTDRTDVWFGGAQAEVVSRADDALVVRTPAGSAGTVDVAVGAGEANDTLRAGYTYWPDATGKTVALALWYRTAYASYTGWDDDVYGVIWTLEPSDAEFHQIWGAMEACDAGSSVTREQWGDALTFQRDDGESWSMGWDSSTSAYAVDDLAADTYDTGALYGLAAGAADAHPAFETGGFIAPVESFSVSSPALTGSAWPVLDVERDIDVRWSGSGGGFVLVWLAGLDTGERLFCIADDDGQFTIDSGYLSGFDADWYSPEFVQFSLMRVQPDEAVLSHDGGVVLGAAAWQVTGLVQFYSY